MKFIVIQTRPSLFRLSRTGNPIEASTFKDSFSHAVNAWKYAQRVRSAQEKDGRWPLFSLKIVTEK